MTLNNFLAKIFTYSLTQLTVVSCIASFTQAKVMGNLIFAQPPVQTGLRSALIDFCKRR